LRFSVSIFSPLFPTFFSSFSCSIFFHLFLSLFDLPVYLPLSSFLCSFLSTFISFFFCLNPSLLFPLPFLFLFVPLFLSLYLSSFFIPPLVDFVLYFCLFLCLFSTPVLGLVPLSQSEPNFPLRARRNEAHSNRTLNRMPNCTTVRTARPLSRAIVTLMFAHAFGPHASRGPCLCEACVQYESLLCQLSVLTSVCPLSGDARSSMRRLLCAMQQVQSCPCRVIPPARYT
jgi:hypothetical protein